MAEPTNFIEANALLALQAGDFNHAEELVARLLPGEAAGLARAASNLANLAHRRIAQERARA